MIAAIARAHLTPTASAAVDQLLRDYPVDPALSRFCTDRPADAMVDEATWADDKRSAGAPGEWHYIDIPLAVSDGNLAEWCVQSDSSGTKREKNPACITEAAAWFLGILQDKKQPGAARADALRYVIHFFGDITQPLHTVDNHDQGGNCDPVTVSYQEKPVVLHSLWDSGLLNDEMTQKHLSGSQLAATIDKEFAPEAVTAKGVDLSAWTWESHGLARAVAYGDLTPPVPVTPRDAGPADKAACDVDRAKIAALHVTIGQPYVDAALPVIHRQIARAAYRLADILNQTF